MKVLLLGATGYIGSAVADHVTSHGHEVVELARGNGDRPGRERRIGDLADPDSLTRAVTPDIDAVVHAATPTGDAATDAAAVDALLAPLRGTGRPFIYTSGVWVLGATGPVPAGEDAATNPIPIVGYRPGIERQVLAAAADDVRATVIRPGIVHGRGRGIPALLVDLARKHGTPVFVTPGDHGGEPVHWPMVHVDDLAELYAAVLQRADAGTIWHGVTEPAVPARDLAHAAGRAAGVLAAPRAWPVAEASEALGKAFADALALDQRVTGDAAGARLGWRPRRPGAVADLANGSYRAYEVLGADDGADDAADDDVQAIAALVAAVEHAQQNELPDAFMSLFRTDNPVWTTAHGKRLAGWDEISAFTHQVLPGAMRESTAVYDIERVLFVRSDVAVVNVRQRPIRLDGDPLPDAPEGRPLHVLAKSGGTWRIAAAQNTQVVRG
ncbi:SgcJ/EcaC family oxidoreductase [Micromonospora sp. CPCC 206061]|uniref:SgcJ/EcaC family oxidoreductase n=1 Tax=Micromonospora sp. CPCC 206061 TaxID=3122410 RepID=UPI002FF1831A